MVSDGLKFKTDWVIGKFYDPDGKIAEATRGKRDADGNVVVPGIALDEAIIRFAPRFIERDEIHGNLATTLGIKYVTYAMSGLGGAPASANKFDSTNGYLVVGTGAGGPAQTDVYATFTAPAVVGPDATWPQISGASPWKVTWQSTFGAGVGTGDWNEFGLGNTNVCAVLFDRVVSAKGTKGAGETWILQLEITYA